MPQARNAGESQTSGMAPRLTAWHAQRCAPTSRTTHHDPPAGLAPLEPPADGATDSTRCPTSELPRRAPAVRGEEPLAPPLRPSYLHLQARPISPGISITICTLRTSHAVSHWHPTCPPPYYRPGLARPNLPTTQRKHTPPPQSVRNVWYIDNKHFSPFASLSAHAERPAGCSQMATSRDA